MRLRPYQREAIEAIERQWDLGRASTLVHWATGLGKTVLFCSVLRRHLEGTRQRALVIAHRTELLTQALAKIRSIWPGVRAGLIQGSRRDYGAQVMVGSIQSLRRRRLPELPPIDYLVIDEAHRSRARTYAQLIDHVREQVPTSRVLGVTATPVRSDGQGLLGSGPYDVVAHRASLSWGVQHGWLCPVRAVVTETHTHVDLDWTRDGEHLTAAAAAGLDTPARNRVIVETYLEHAADRRALVFAASVAHAHHLREALEEGGVAAGVITGGTPARERSDLLDRFQRADLRALVNVGVLTEGYDDPTLDCILLARPVSRAALGLYAQMIGRGTRTAPDKSDCLVLDYVDACETHDLSRLDDLVDRTPQPRGEATARRCPECDEEISRSAQTCPYCAADLRAPQQAAVELDEVVDRVDHREIPDLTQIEAELRVSWSRYGTTRVASLEDRRGTVIAWYDSEAVCHYTLLETVDGVTHLLDVWSGIDEREGLRCLYALGCRYDSGAWWRRQPCSPAQRRYVERLARQDGPEALRLAARITTMGRASDLIGYLLARQTYRQRGISSHGAEMR